MCINKLKFYLILLMFPNLYTIMRSPLVLFLILCLSHHNAAEVKENDIIYLLSNTQAIDESLEINDYGNNVIHGRPLKILIHGWQDDIDAFWYESATDTYVNLGVNVFKIDWSVHSQQIYSTSMRRLPLIANYMSQFIIVLIRSQGVQIADVHLLGHSLGGQLTVFIDQVVQKQSGLIVGRITGLDPAGPGFVTAADNERLDSSDAMKVDVVHSDSGLVGLGISISVRHVNFWPNGGDAVQPGCNYFLCSYSR